MRPILLMAGLFLFTSACTTPAVQAPAVTVTGQESSTTAPSAPPVELGLAEVAANGETTLNTQQIAAVLGQTPVVTLSTSEREGLIFMREEEKLAFDVYTALGEKWSDQRFQNISRSEASHTASVLVLLEKYELKDPNATHAAGIYENAELQQVHDDLVAKGEVSLVEALKVGAEVEELDILDLQRLLKDVLSEDIRLVYEELLRGSRNHLRAFVKGLNQNGSSYTAVHLSQAGFDTIAQGDMERGANTGSGAAAGVVKSQGRQR
jgi:hypothetical protein